MADIKIRVEVVLCPDEVLAGSEPDPTWPRYADLKVRFRDVATGVDEEATTGSDGVAESPALPAAAYRVSPHLPLVGPVDGWTFRPDPLDVAADQAGQRQRIRLVPPAGSRLLHLLLQCEEPGGKTNPLDGAKVIVEALGEAAWSREFASSPDGNIYALVPRAHRGKEITSVKLKFQSSAEFEPKYAEITLSIPDPNAAIVERPAFLYVPTKPQRAPFAGISVEPKIIDLSGSEVPLVGATVTVKQQGSSSQPGRYVRTLEDKDGEEVRFPSLESGVYLVTVTPPMTFNGWPIKAASKEVGPYYLRADEHLKAVVAPFGVEQINLLIETPDDRSLDHEVQLVIFGPDGSTEVSAERGTFSTAAPSKGPLKIKLAAGAAPTTGGVPLEIQPPSQDIGNPPYVTKVSLQYRHAIVGRAVQDGGSPMPGAVIVLYDGAKEEARAVAGDDGQFIAGVKKAGSYSIAIQTEGGQPVTQRLVSVHSTVNVGEVVFRRWAPPETDSSPPTGGGGGTGENGRGEVREAMTDLSAYPVLTEEVSTTGPPAPLGGGTAGGAGAGYGQIVDQAMRDVLGWRPSKDAAGFQTALTGAFQLRQVEGHTEWSWQQRGYAVQADMGALTGAQASIYARAKSALDQIQPLLAGITALNPLLYPPEDLEAIRAIIAAELQQLVDELALVGGPRIQRVNELFMLLTQQTEGADSWDPDVVQGQLGVMRERFGLTQQWVETVDDERILTNFRILVEQVLALQKSWFYDRTLLRVGSSTSSLGTILIWLSRGLEAVCESVDDLTFSLDSVYVDAAQRQVTELHFGHNRAPMFLSDLLDWVVQSCRDQGPRMIQDSGKDGVRAFTPVLKELRSLVQDARNLIGHDRDLPDGMRTPRAHRAFQVLVAKLDEASRLAGLVSQNLAPQITSAWIVDQDTGALTPLVNVPSSERTIEIELSGTNFRRRASIRLVPVGREDLADLPGPPGPTL
jgi:hypothetical protein